jgi:stage II sporulation protein M
MNKNKKHVWKREILDLFEESFRYVYAQRYNIYLVFFVFLISSFFGFFYSSDLGVLDKFLNEIAENTKGLDFLQMVWFIFSNNVTSAVTSFIGGIFFGIFPLFNSFFNGTILGYVYSKAVPIAGYAVIWRLLPHGIFELPAVFIALGLGIHLGTSFFSRDKIKNFKHRFSNSLKAFLAIVVPLLILAAIIESFLIVFVG